MTNTAVEDKEEIEKELESITKKLKKASIFTDDWETKFLDERTVIFAYSDAYDRMSITVEVQKDKKGFKYVGEAEEVDFTDRVMDKKEYDEWMGRKTIVLEESPDTIIKIGPFVEEQPELAEYLEFSEEELEELEKYEKLPPQEYDKVHEERIQFLLTPMFKGIRMVVETRNPDLLVKTLKEIDTFFDLYKEATDINYIGKQKSVEMK